MAVKRSGRRPGQPTTRELILKTARQAFAASGYSATSLRGIARAAGVDPGLVVHYFGTKDNLFARALGLPLSPTALIDQLLAAGLDGLGERLVRTFVSIWDDPSTRAPLLALIRSAVSHEESAASVRQFIGEEMAGRLAALLGGPDAHLRATAVGAQLFGLALLRYILQLEPLASTDPDQLAKTVGPAIQRYLTG
ncbi:MAG: TetR family transcriptional regulator [Chloroflexota bacterium]|nr:TetR family transcriptional regulator [Chloroflexota bacterium]